MESDQCDHRDFARIIFELFHSFWDFIRHFEQILKHSFTHSCVRVLIHPFIHLFFCLPPSFHTYIYSLIHSSVASFVRLSIYSYVHPMTNHSMTAFRRRNEEAEEELKTINKHIEELGGEIENHSFFSGVGEEPDDERQQRLFILDTLKTELKKRESELAITTKLNDQRLETGAPSLQKIDNLTTEIEMDKEKIVARRKDRVRLAGTASD